MAEPFRNKRGGGCDSRIDSQAHRQIQNSNSSGLLQIQSTPEINRINPAKASQSRSRGQRCAKSRVDCSEISYEIPDAYARDTSPNIFLMSDQVTIRSGICWSG